MDRSIAFWRSWFQSRILKKIMRWSSQGLSVRRWFWRSWGIWVFRFRVCMRILVRILNFIWYRSMWRERRSVRGWCLKASWVMRRCRSGWREFCLYWLVSMRSGLFIGILSWIMWFCDRGTTRLCWLVLEQCGRQWGRRLMWMGRVRSRSWLGLQALCRVSRRRVEQCFV